MDAESNAREREKEDEREAIERKREEKKTQEAALRRERAKSFSHKISRHFFSTFALNSVANASSFLRRPRFKTSEIKIGIAQVTVHEGNGTEKSIDARIIELHVTILLCAKRERKTIPDERSHLLGQSERKRKGKRKREREKFDLIWFSYDLRK